MGGHPPHGLGTGVVTGTGGVSITEEAPASTGKKEVVIHLNGCGKGRYGV